MVVRCPGCGTRFNLAAGRIAGSSARVRCSRCQHVFRITPEGVVLGAEPEPSLPGAPGDSLDRGDRPGVPVAPAEPPKPSGEAASEKEAGPEKGASVAPAASPRPGRGWRWALALVLLAGFLGAGGWWYLQKEPAPAFLKPLKQLLPGRQAAAPQPQPAPAATTAEAPGSTVVTPPPAPVPSPDLETLPVDWAQLRYQGLVNPKGGRLLVILGEVANVGKTPRGPIRLKATLTDAQHRPVQEEFVYLGTSFSEDELKTLEPDQIRAWLTQPGGRTRVPVLKPGQKQAFTVVFFGVPDNPAESRFGFQLLVVAGPEAAGNP